MGEIWGRLEELIEGAAVHEIGAHEAGEGEQAGADLGGVLGELDEQVGDQGAGDLDADGDARLLRGRARLIRRAGGAAG